MSKFSPVAYPKRYSVTTGAFSNNKIGKPSKTLVTTKPHFEDRLCLWLPQDVNTYIGNFTCKADHKPNKVPICGKRKHRHNLRA